MNTAKVTSQVTINADRAQVFDYLTDLQYHYLWNPHLKEVSSTGVLHQGMTYQATSWLFGVEIKTTNTVIGFVPGRELQIDNKTGVLRYNLSYRLVTVGRDTKLTCVIKMDADNRSFAFAQPVLELFARRELQADLRALKTAVEEQLH